MLRLVCTVVLHGLCYILITTCQVEDKNHPEKESLLDNEKMLVISFFFFPQCSLPFQNPFLTLESHLFCCMQMFTTWTI